jgi:hypothetical protein
MNQLHADMLRAVIDAARRGVSSREISGYFTCAAEGMKVNAAFCVSPDDLARLMENELEDLQPNL